MLKCVLMLMVDGAADGDVELGWQRWGMDLFCFSVGDDYREDSGSVAQPRDEADSLQQALQHHCFAQRPLEVVERYTCFLPVGVRVRAMPCP